MALVDYPDSDDSDDSDETQWSAHPETTGNADGSDSSKSKGAGDPNPGLPPLPKSFHNLYASTTRTSKDDDPSLHDGRLRAAPHVEGQWPTHVYIEWHPSKGESSRLHSLLASINHPQLSAGRFRSLLISELGADLPLHISLSRPIVLLTHERQPFIDALTLAISKSGIRPLEISARGLSWVANHENTRWFLVIQVQKPPRNELNKLLRVSNETAMAFKQPPLYTEQLPPGMDDGSPKLSQRSVTGKTAPAKGSSTGSHSQKGPPSDHDLDVSPNFHISIGWMLKAPSQNMVLMLNRVSVEQSEGFQFPVDTVKVKIGNGVIDVPLSSKEKLSGGIIES